MGRVPSLNTAPGSSTAPGLGTPNSGLNGR
jgi:hypothetical protein